MTGSTGHAGETMLCVYLFLGGGGGEEADGDGDDDGDGAEDDGEVQVVDAPQHGRRGVEDAAAGGREGEFQNHPRDTDNQTHHQTPEGSLNTEQQPSATHSWAELWNS